MKSIKNLLKAIWNYFLNKCSLLSEEKLDIAVERVLVCTGCNIREGKKCSKNKQGINLESGKPIVGCGCSIRLLILSEDKNSCVKSAWKR